MFGSYARSGQLPISKANCSISKPILTISARIAHGWGDPKKNTRTITNTLWCSIQSHKAFNEFQAKDYIDKHGMTITAVRPANVTGPDKVRGSVDHVNIITRPARGEAISFPFADAMRCPIHVDDIAEVFVRVLMTDKPRHAIYNSGGHATSLAEIATIVRGYLPDAKITFDKETGGRASSGNWLIDNTRLVQEFGVQYQPYRERVLQIINDCRAEIGQPPIRG